jgi:hypothetical protein
MLGLGFFFKLFENAGKEYVQSSFVAHEAPVQVYCLKKNAPKFVFNSITVRAFRAGALSSYYYNLMMI